MAVEFLEETAAPAQSGGGVEWLDEPVAPEPDMPTSDEGPAPAPVPVADLSRTDIIPPDEPTAGVMSDIHRSNDTEDKYYSSLSDLQKQYDTELKPAKDKLDAIENQYGMQLEKGFSAQDAPAPLKEARMNAILQERAFRKKYDEVRALGPVPVGEAGQVSYEPPMNIEDRQAARQQAELQPAIDAEKKRQENIKTLGYEPSFLQTTTATVAGGLGDMLGEVMRQFEPSGIPHEATAYVQNMAHDANIVAALNTSGSGSSGRALGGFLNLVTGNPAGKAGMLVATIKGALEARARTYDATGNADLADKAALKTLPELGLYLLGGSMAGRAVGSMLPEGTSAIKTGLAEAAGSTIVNIGVSNVIAKLEDRNYDLGNMLADTLFGAMHGLNGYAGKVEEAARERAHDELLARGFTDAQLMNARDKANKQLGTLREQQAQQQSAETEAVAARLRGETPVPLGGEAPTSQEWADLKPDQTPAFELKPPTGEPNAIQNPENAQLHGDVLNPEGTPESTGALPANESSPGVPPRGQGEVVAAPAPEAAPAEVTPKQRGFTVNPQVDNFGTEATPVAFAILDKGGLISKKMAERSGNQGAQWDSQPPLARPVHERVYSASGQTPADMAQTLYEDGLINDPYPDTMWAALAKESQTAKNTWLQEKAQRTEQAATQRESTQQDKDFTRDTKSAEGKQPIPVEELAPGDKVKVGEETLTVTHVDPDTNDVTLEDGKKYGVQEVKDGQVIYGEHVEKRVLPSAPSGGVEFLPTEDQMAQPEAPSATPPTEPPAPSEAPVGDAGNIGAWNAKVDEQRAARGRPPLVSEARKPDPVLWDTTMDKIAREVIKPDEIVSQVNSGKKKIATDEEQTALLYRMVDLHNKLDTEAHRYLDAAASDADRAEAKINYDRLERQFQETEEADRKVGTEQGRALRARRLIADENYNLVGIMRRLSMAKAGKPVSPEELQKAKEDAAKVKEAGEKLDELSAGGAVDESIRAIEEEAAKNPEFTPEVKSLADRIIARLDKAAEAALARWKSKIGRLGAGIDPTLLLDAVTYGAAKITKGLLNFGKWSAAMIKDMGREVEPYLEEAWIGANKQIDASAKIAHPRIRQKVKEAVTKENVIKASDEIGAEIKTRVAGGEKFSDLRASIDKLMETLVQGGIKGRDNLVDAVHEQLKTADPTITRRQTMDLMSGYGNFKKLNPDPVKAEIRDYKQQLQLVAKIEDIQNKIPLAKSGVERQALSDESRRLTQELNENIKKYGVVVSDPATQLKTILAAQETRLTNRIKDLRAEIAAGERRVKTKTQPPSNEKIAALKKELAEVEAEHEKTFGKRQMTDEQKLANAVSSAKRAEAAENARLEKAKRGIFDKPIKNPAQRSAELDAIKARTEAARAERKALEEAANPPMSEAQKRLDAALVSRERWDQLLAGEIAPANKVPREALTQLEEDARAEIAAMRELAAQMRRDAKPENDPEAAKETATIKAMEKAAAEYERRLNEADFTGRGKTQTVDTLRVSKARALRDAAKAAFDAAKKAANPGPTEAQRKLNAIRTNLARRTAEAQKKLAAGDFTKPPKRVPTPLTPELLKAKAHYEGLKEQIDRGIEKERLKNRTFWEKGADMLAKWNRAAILSGPVTLAKLTTAAAYRLAAIPAEEIAGSGLRRLFPRAAARAPFEGRGFEPRLEAQSIAKGVTRGLMDAWNTVKSGKSTLDTAIGKKDIAPRSILDIFGAIHGALKAPVKRTYFERSMAKRVRSAAEAGVDVTDPAIQTQIVADAYKDAQRSIFMQDNIVASMVSRMAAMLEAPNSKTGKVSGLGKAGATAVRLALPIVKVPTNIVAEIFQHVFGLPYGLGRLAREYARGIEKLHPDEADAIFRSMKKGSLGTAMLLYGFYAPNQFGGQYSPGLKKNENEAGFGEMKVGNKKIPKFLIHNPLLETAQVGATIRHVMDQKIKGKTQGLMTGIGRGLLGALEEAPQFDESVRIAHLTEQNGPTKYFGELARSVAIPQLVQQIARWTDSTKRKPAGFVDILKEGIPGLRQQVPAR